MRDSQQLEDQSHYNTGGMIAFVFSMVFTLGFFGYVTFVHKGVQLKEVADVQPDATQTLAGGAAKPAAPKKIANIAAVKDPWISTPELVDHGAAVYQTNCAVCHGPKGLGDGPGAGVVPPPRNLVEGKWTRGGDSLSLFNTLTKGSPGTSMAPFAHLVPAERWALVHFVRSITQNKVADNDAKLAADAPKLK